MADRKRFIEELNADLAAIDAQLDQFMTQYRENVQGAKFRTDDRLDTLQQRRENIRTRSRDLEEFEGDDWNARRREIENARDDLKRSLARVRNQLHH